MNISIASGKGGTGKTTVAVNLALTVQPSVYVDCDVEEPNGHILLKPNITSELAITKKLPEVDLSKCNYCGKCSELCEFNAIIVLKSDVIIFEEMCHSCGVCSYFCPENAIVEIEKSIGAIRKGTIEAGSLDFIDGELNIGEMSPVPLIKQVRKEALYNHINIIDAPPGTSCSMVASVKGTDYCILVTESTPFGLNDLKLAVKVVQSVGVQFGVVINKYDDNFPDVEKYCCLENIPVLLKIPFERKIADLYSQGIPIVHFMPQFKEKFGQLFDKICLMLESKKCLSAVEK
jgi:MinD superfamily P-loop ATPase